MSPEEERLMNAKIALVLAREEYDESLRVCTEAGVSNVTMAKLTGVSEVAIRTYKVRHGIKKEARS